LAHAFGKAAINHDTAWQLKLELGLVTGNYQLSKTAYDALGGSHLKLSNSKDAFKENWLKMRFVTAKPDYKARRAILEYLNKSVPNEKSNRLKTLKAILKSTDHESWKGQVPEIPEDIHPEDFLLLSWAPAWYASMEEIEVWEKRIDQASNKTGADCLLANEMETLFPLSLDYVRYRKGSLKKVNSYKM